MKGETAMQIHKCSRLGMEVFIVIAEGRVFGVFLSEAGARSAWMSK